MIQHLRGAAPRQRLRYGEPISPASSPAAWAPPRKKPFIAGNGTHKPTGLLHDTLGAELGVTAASSVAITADELIDLQHSLKSGYRRKGLWIMNDATLKTAAQAQGRSGQFHLAAGAAGGAAGHAAQPEGAGDPTTCLHAHGGQQGHPVRRLQLLLAGGSGGPFPAAPERAVRRQRIR